MTKFILKKLGTMAITVLLISIAVFYIITLTVLAYNFMGDGLRDAADPYK